MSPEQRRIQLVVAAALICAAVVLRVPLTAVRAVFAVPLCLVLPGYAITRALFPRQPLGGPQAMMLTLALSFATLVIGAVILDVLPGGLRRNSWVALLLVVVLGAAAVATLRRPQLPRPRRWAIRLRVSEALALTLALVLAGGAFALSRIPLKAPHAVGYTELWMFTGVQGSSPAVRIGVSSAEQRTTAFRLVIQKANSKPFVVARRLVLKPGGTAQFEVPLKLSVPIAALVTAKLYRGSQGAPYRQATALIVPPLNGLLGVRPPQPAIPLSEHVVPARLPAVDIVVNNYNYADYLRAAVDSALAQDHPDVHVVVVDDGSSDGSLEILESYGEAIELVRKANGGQASALNAGFERCRGEVVIFLDADDVLCRGTAASAAAALARAPDAVRVHWRVELIDGLGHSLGATRPARNRALPRGDLRRSELSFPFDMPWAAMSANAFRADALRAIMPIPEDNYGRWGADWYLVHLTSLLGPVAALEELGGLYRVHGANAFEPASPVLDLARIRREVEYQATTLEAVEELADRLSLDRPRRVVSLSNVAVRLISLRLAPSEHPISGDRRLTLMRDACQAARRRFDVSVTIRLALVVWLGAIALTPRRVAARLAALLVFPELRPGRPRRPTAIERRPTLPLARTRVNEDKCES